MKWHWSESKDAATTCCACRVQTARQVEVFADGLSRAIAQTLPRTADYRLVQTGPASLALYVDAPGAPLTQYQAHLSAYLQRLGVAAANLQWELHASLPATDFSAKRRRITRQRETN